MCDSIEEGGRRCPSSCAEERSAKDRARYAARKAGSATKPPTDGGGVAVMEREHDPHLDETIRVAIREGQLNAAVNDAQNYYYSEPGLPEGQPFDIEQLRRVQAEHAAEMDAFKAKYGTPDKAIIEAGSIIAEKGEEYAGITAIQVQQDWEQRTAAVKDAIAEKEKGFAHLTKEAEEARASWLGAWNIPGSQRESDHSLMLENLRKESRAASDALAAAQEASGIAALQEEYRKIHAGKDPETIAGLQRLADGYKKALSETRELGGAELTFNAKSPAKARAVFNSAVDVFPTDWIEASNARTPMYARIADSRAHYADSARITKKEKQDVSYIVVRDSQPEGSVFYDYKPVPGVEGQYRRTSYEAVRGYDRDTKPKGPRWEWYAGEDMPDGIWRRTRQRMETVESEIVPEIKTNRRAGALGGAGIATARHEFSHRCEASVPGIRKMEDDFLVRRTTDAKTGEREKISQIAGHSRKELGWKDSFAHHYMGKHYQHGSREILSMGTESVFNGEYGGMVGVGNYKPDHEYRSFILGIMAVAKK